MKDLQGESFTNTSQGPWHFSARHYSSGGCNLQASGCVSCPPLVEIAPVFLCSSLQLLHWKQRNVCGQDHRGQAAEGIWHPSEAWFWRYVEIRGYNWGYLQVGLFARCYLQVIPLEFVERGGLWQNTGKSFEVTTTMSLLCISSYIEDGCSSGSRACMQESNQTQWFPFFFSSQAERVRWILILFLIRAAWRLCVTFWAFDLKIGENPSVLSTLTSFTSALHYHAFWWMLKRTGLFCWNHPDIQRHVWSLWFWFSVFANEEWHHWVQYIGWNWIGHFLFHRFDNSIWGLGCAGSFSDDILFQQWIRAFLMDLIQCGVWLNLLISIVIDSSAHMCIQQVTFNCS